MKKWYDYFTKYTSSIFVIIFVSCSVLESILDTAQTYLAREMFNNISDTKKALMYAGIILLTYAGFVLTFIVMRYIRTSCGCRVTNTTVKEIFTNILYGKSESVDNTPISDITTGIECSEGLYNDMLDCLDSLAYIVMVYISGVFFMYRISPQITIPCVVVTGLGAVVIYHTKRKMGEYSEQKTKLYKARWDIVNRLPGYRVIRFMNREKYEESRLDKVHENLLDLFMGMTNLQCRVNVTRHIMNATVDGIILGGSIYLSGKGLLTPIDGLALFSLSTNILRPLQNIANIIEYISRMSANLNKVYKVSSIEEEPSGPIKLREFRDAIRFDNLNFQYEDSQHVLRDVNLRIHKGESIGIYGPSGEGKSTIIKLLTKLRNPENNQIFIDDIDINDIDNTSLRDKIGVVSQDPVLFSDINIMENIRYGRLDATDAEVRMAAKMACIHDTIERFPNGYQSMIGNNGVKLSGGEKQRLCIARTILQNPDILILDEATSGLDNISEKKVKEALNELTKGKTTIAIAHRITTIKGCDRLIGIKNHRICEEGKYDELISDENSLLYELEHSVEE